MTDRPFNKTLLPIVTSAEIQQSYIIHPSPILVPGSIVQPDPQIVANLYPAALTF